MVLFYIKKKKQCNLTPDATVSNTHYVLMLFKREMKSKEAAGRRIQMQASN